MNITTAQRVADALNSRVAQDIWNKPMIDRVIGKVEAIASVIEGEPKEDDNSVVLIRTNGELTGGFGGSAYAVYRWAYSAIRGEYRQLLAKYNGESL